MFKTFKPLSHIYYLIYPINNSQYLFSNNFFFNLKKVYTATSHLMAVPINLLSEKLYPSPTLDIHTMFVMGFFIQWLKSHQHNGPISIITNSFADLISPTRFQVNLWYDFQVLLNGATHLDPLPRTTLSRSQFLDLIHHGEVQNLCLIVITLTLQPFIQEGNLLEEN